MDSRPTPPSTPLTWSPRLPGWALARGRDVTESDAAFAAGIALKSLDDLIHADPPWLGCWRDRLAHKSAGVASRMVARSEEENALRDAVLLTATSGDPGPAGKLFLATRMLTRRSGQVTTSFVKEIADLFGLRWDDGLASIPDIVDSANQSGRAAPIAVADFITAISAVRPDAEVLALGWANPPQPTPVDGLKEIGNTYSTTGSWRNCRRNCAGVNGCCGWRR